MTTNSPNPVDGDVQALIERLNRVAEKLKWHNVGYAQDILKAVNLLTTPPAQILRPVELPQSFYGEVHDGKVVMLPANDGQWLNKTAVIEALRQQGYEVKND